MGQQEPLVVDHMWQAYLHIKNDLHRAGSPLRSPLERNDDYLSALRWSLDALGQLEDSLGARGEVAKALRHQYPVAWARRRLNSPREDLHRLEIPFPPELLDILGIDDDQGDRLLSELERSKTSAEPTS